MELRASTCSTDTEAAVERMMARGVRTLIIKMGAQGARVVTREGTDVMVPAPDVVPVNATGTGDVFNAALLVALSEGRDLDEAVRFACAAGAVRVSSGCHTYPTREDAERLLSQKG